MMYTNNFFPQGPPSEPAGVTTIDGTANATSVLLQWKIGTSNGSPILSFVVEAFNMMEGFWRIIGTSMCTAL